jgi:hypothetical protein
MGAVRSAIASPARTRGLIGVLLVWASAFGCASPPDVGGATEAVDLAGFDVRVPAGPDWNRRVDGSTLGVFRTISAEWSHGMVFELTVPPPFPEPVHPYDLLAAARMNASNLDREKRFEILQHDEKLIRHHGMDCADFRFAMQQAVEVGAETGYSIIVGRGLVCAHPTDRRRIANLQFAVQNLDGRVLAVDEALGNAFLDSIRARPVD